MAKMTERSYKRLVDELAEVTEDLNEAIKARAAAREFGDLSENAEYQSASTTVIELTAHKAELENKFNEAEIAEIDYGPRISIGSVVEVCKVGASGKPISEVRRFEVDSSGDTVTQHILGINSPLGSAILNGTNGIYKIANGGGTSYLVKKVFDE